MVTSSREELISVYRPVEEYCKRLIESPDIFEFKEIRQLVNDTAASLNIPLSQSYHNNLIRKVKQDFPALKFLQRKEHRTVLVYPDTLAVEDVVVMYHEMSQELKSIHKLNDVEKSVMKVGKVLRQSIFSHPKQISWPPKEEELRFANVSKCIPHLLDLFSISLFSGSTSVSESTQSF